MVASSRNPVVCPDCGQSFTARGLSGHRRQRHGIAPAPALPAAAERIREHLPAILDALSMLQESVARIEGQLVSRESLVEAVETPAEEIERRDRELADLLLRISELKRGGLAATDFRAPASEAALRSSLELARLRREQARIVYRIQELRLGCASDDRFLI
jgi:hypothetical protein